MLLQTGVADPPSVAQPSLANPTADPPSSPGSTAARGYEPPAVRSGKDGWEQYVDPPTLEPAGATEIKPGNDSPEAAVVHFYASRMRGDHLYEQVLVPERSRRLQRKLDELAEWKFLALRLVKRKTRADGSLWLKIYWVV